MGQPGRTFEGSTTCAASPSEVWEVWTDPASWVGEPISEARLHGAFEIGGRITTRVTGFPRSTSTITEVDPPRRWVGVAKAPGVKMTYEHLIEPTDAGTLITERAIISGPMAGIAARLLGPRLVTTFIATTTLCARLAEERSAP